MADDNKPMKPAWPVGRYAKYAVGEIALVVIGILIALQINTWNEERKTRATTITYLENIKKDLIADTIGINNLIKNGEGWKNRIGKYYEYYDQKQWTVNQIVDSCKRTGFAFYNYIPINITYNDMLSSGKTSLLSDVLRKQLSLLKKEQDLLYMISDHMIADTKTNLHELEKYWEMDNSTYFKKAVPQRVIQYEKSTTEERSTQDKELLKGLKFHHNIFNWTYKSIYFHEERGSKIKNQSEIIINQINREIKP